MGIQVTKKKVAGIAAPVSTTAPEAKVEVKQAVATVSKLHSDGSTEETKELVGAPQQFTAPMANVGVSLGMTKNLGNYNNIKFQVSLHIPCLPTAEEIDNAYEEAKAWVDSKVEQIDQEITEQLGH